MAARFYSPAKSVKETNSRIEVAFDSKNLVTRIHRIGSINLVLDEIQDLDKAHDFLLSRRKHELKNWGESDIFPHFGVLWPSALVLSDYLMKRIGNGQLVKNSFELGCGLGVPSLVLKKIAPNCQVFVTDKHPWVPQMLSRNMRHNKVTLNFRTLDWRNHHHLAELGPYSDFGPGPDLVIGSDLLYYPWQPRALAYILKALLHGGGEAFIADPGRRYLQVFCTELERIGLVYKLIQKTGIVWGKSEVFVTIIGVSVGETSFKI